MRHAVNFTVATPSKASVAAEGHRGLCSKFVAVSEAVSLHTGRPVEK